MSDCSLQCHQETIVSDYMRAALGRIVKLHRVNCAELSRLLNRNDAYIQQFIKRGSPRLLQDSACKVLANYIGVPISAFYPPGYVPSPTRNLRQAENQRDLAITLDLVERAIEICDNLGLQLATCHLQHGLDVLRDPQHSNFDQMLEI